MEESSSHVSIHESLGRISIGMTYFCLLFALAFALTVDKEQLRQAIMLYTNYPVVGVTAGFTIAAITFFSLYVVNIYTIRDSELNKSKVPAKLPIPIVYTDRKLD